jgi:hypothetical protein
MGDKITVYVLSTGEYSDWTILGIYSTREKAEKAKAHFERPRTVDWQNEPFSSRANPIFEVVLNEPHDKNDYLWCDEPHLPL